MKANEAAMGRQNQRHARKRAVEMPGLWKAWKAKSRLPPLSTAPWKSRQERARFPHFHSSGDEGGWKVENQKQVSHFPTATNPFSPGRKNRAAQAGFALRPAAGASPRPKSQRVVVVDREK